jgi:hypothetical protein
VSEGSDSVGKGPQPLIDVWIAYRRPQLAAEKAEMEGCHFLGGEMRFGRGENSVIL